MPPYPFVGFVAGTPILTAKGYKPIEEIKPGDMIQVQPYDDQGDGKPEAHDDQADEEPGWWETASMPIKGIRRHPCRKRCQEPFFQPVSGSVKDDACSLTSR
jgi:hypothetical protein